MTTTAVNLEIDRSFCRLTQGSVNFKIDGSYSSNKFIIVSSAGRVHALYKKLETKGFLNFHPLRKSTPFPTITVGRVHAFYKRLESKGDGLGTSKSVKIWLSSSFFFQQTVSP